MLRHGEPQYAEFHDEDPEMALANADMTTWLAANPCLAEHPDLDEASRREDICFGTEVCRCS